MNSEREIVNRLFESKDIEDLDEKTYTVSDTQYWRRSGKCYKWTSSGGRAECSEDEYMKAISGGDHPVQNTEPEMDKAKKSEVDLDDPKVRSRVSQMRRNVQEVVDEYINMMEDMDYPELSKEDCLKYVKDSIYGMSTNGSTTRYGAGMKDDLKFLGNDMIDRVILTYATDILDPNEGGNDKVSFSINNDYHTPRVESEYMVQSAVDDVKKAVIECSDDTDDIERIWWRLHDYFPGSLEGDESEKVIDTRNGKITTVGIDLWDNDGKLEAKLTPHSYSYEEFSDDELRNWGIDV